MLEADRDEKWAGVRVRNAGARDPPASEEGESDKLTPGLQAKIGQVQGLLCRETFVDADTIATALGVDGQPSAATDMPRVDDRGRESLLAPGGHQIDLNLRLVDAVLSRRTAWMVLLVGCPLCRPVGPDRSTVQKVVDTTSEGVHHRLILLRREGDQVDDDIRIDRLHPLLPRPGLLFGATIGHDPVHLWPAQRFGGVLGLCMASNDDDLVPSLEQSRDEITANVAGSTDDENTHRRLLHRNRGAESVRDRPTRSTRRDRG